MAESQVIFDFFNEPRPLPSDDLTDFHTEGAHVGAFDFETYYDSEVSVKLLGNRGYFEDPKFDPYYIAVALDNGVTWAGNPKEFPFRKLDGMTLVAHNMTFDGSLLEFGAEKGWWEMPEGCAYHCTADMAAYLRMPRALDKVIQEVWPDLVPNKNVRSRMSGREFGFMKPDDQRELRAYAIADAELCLKLWQEFESQWPEWEREISRVNRKIISRGIYVDLPKAVAAQESLLQQRFEADRQIPWLDHSKRLSRPAFDEECRKHGIVPPVSLDKRDPAAEAFFEKYKEDYPFVLATKKWRDVNALYQKVDSLVRGVCADGRYYGNLRYGGGHTMRFSGKGSSLNLHNPPKDEMHGVDFRPLLIPAPGNVFLSADWSQIEVRTLAYLAGDFDVLEQIDKHEDMYQYFAEKFGWWEPGKEGFRKALRNGKPLRNATKTTVLGCGFQAWGPSVAAGSRGLFTDEEAVAAVKDYRNAMPGTVALWDKYQKYIEWCCENEKDLIMELPSGRKINYGQIWWAEGQHRKEYFYRGVKSGRKCDRTIYGGKLTENMAQALARDVLCDTLLRLDKIDIPVILHIHDEVLGEVEEQLAEEMMETVLAVMSERVPWAPEIPLAAEGSILTHFSKD